MPIPSQIELVTGIMKLFGHTQVEVRHINAITNAANTILAEFARPSVKAQPGMGLSRWLASDDTGMSSKYLAGILSDSYTPIFAYPHDPDDFGRCYRLLRAVPDLRAKMEEALPDCPQPWPMLWKHWDELEKLYEAALAPNPPIGCKCLYDRLQQLYKEVGVR